MKRVYVCHTFYHVFISIIKEFHFKKQELAEALDYEKPDILLSTMSTDFDFLDQTLTKSNLFSQVLLFEEQREAAFPELMKYKKNKGNIVLNTMSRILFTKKFAKALAPYVPVDFRSYDDIYVFCDNDPIGIYLSQNKIYYHAVEDGLNYLKPFIPAKFDNRGCFPVKKILSLYFNLIFIRDGYNKYCLDMEVNDLSCVDDDFPKYKEVPRKALFDELTESEVNTLLEIFVKDDSKLQSLINLGQNAKNSILILTEPLCSLDVRERLFKDLVEEYSQKGTVFIKPHPRDVLDYEAVFPDLLVFEKKMPMEVLQLMKNTKFHTIVSVYTPLDALTFAEHKVKLGHDFMDLYEDPSIHRKSHN